MADGVGGWRRYGIDPSEFSSRLMKICSDLVQLGEASIDCINLHIPLRDYASFCLKQCDIMADMKLNCVVFYVYSGE